MYEHTCGTLRHDSGARLVAARAIYTTDVAEKYRAPITIIPISITTSIGRRSGRSGGGKMYKEIALFLPSFSFLSLQPQTIFIKTMRFSAEVYIPFFCNTSRAATLENGRCLCACSNSPKRPHSSTGTLLTRKRKTDRTTLT